MLKAIMQIGAENQVVFERLTQKTQAPSGPHDQTPRHLSIGGQTGRVLASEINLSARRTDKTGRTAHHRRLSRPVVADDGDELTASHVQRNIANGNRRAVAQFQLADIEKDFAHAHISSVPAGVSDVPK